MDSYDYYSNYMSNGLEALEYIERRHRLEQDRNADFDDLDDVDFFARYRFKKRSVEFITDLLAPKLETSSKNRALSALEQVLIGLRFFGSGVQQINLGDLQGASQPTISRTVENIARSLAELCPIYITLPRTENERREISQKFYDMCGFPSVYGAIDCSHIPIVSQGGMNAETFRCRKGYFSLNVQTMSDSDLRVRNISARWPGSVHDSTILDRSYLRAVMETEMPTNYHVLGDSGYSLRTYIMTPFLRPSTPGQLRYNKSHASGRNVVERQYGLLKKRFHCLKHSLRCNLDTTMAVITATAVLHNIALDLRDEIEEDDIEIEGDAIMDVSPTTSGIAKRNRIVAEWFS